jgi:integrase/recombinase XerD
MTTEILPYRPYPLDLVPATIADAGDGAARRFMEFFTANVRNPNTRQAYHRAAVEFFAWLEQRGLRELHHIEPMVVAAYIEQLQGTLSPPSVKQHLAGIRMLFDWLVVGQVLPANPASSVRGPKHVVKKGKTPVLEADDARRLLDSIQIERTVRRRGEETVVPDIVGLRDRALIAVMVYSFARVGAVVGMRVEDYYQVGRRSWLRLHEKGGKLHEVPAHHNAEAYLDAYLAVAGIATEKKGALFRSTVGKTRRLTTDAMHRVDVFRMIKRRAKAAGVSELVCCHTFRATGITVYLQNGGTLEKAQQIAAHESARTTKLYDRTQDQISLDEVERIAI